MSYLPKTKVFDEETYRLHNDYLKFDIADWEANKLRSKGWKARVVKQLGLYGIYKRR